MPAADAADDRDLAADRSNEIQEMPPEQLRVVALRLRGKRWSEIAAALGVTPWTVWHWRQINPEIDALIASESADCVDAGKHGLAALVPKAVRALRQELAHPDPVGGKIRVAAARYVLDVFKRVREGEDRRGPMNRRTETLTDGELDSALSDAPSNDNGEGEP